VCTVLANPLADMAAHVRVRKRLESIIMKFLTVTGAAGVLLFLGTISTVSAQHEEQQAKPEEKHAQQPPKQQPQQRAQQPQKGQPPQRAQESQKQTTPQRAQQPQKEQPPQRVQEPQKQAIPQRGQQPQKEQPQQHAQQPQRQEPQKQATQQRAQQAQKEPPQPRAQQQAPQQRVQTQPQRAPQQAQAWQQQRGWLKPGGWQAHASFQQDGSQNWASDHRTWAQRGGYGGSYIAQNSYSLYFGSEHFFRLGVLPVMYMGYPRFAYGGYSFLLVDPYPGNWSPNWYASDDCYIDYQDGYYLHDRRYPGINLAIAITL
jgi:hypothetical protein